MQDGDCSRFLATFRIDRFLADNCAYHRLVRFRVVCVQLFEQINLVADVFFDEFEDLAEHSDELAQLFVDLKNRQFFQ